jgi:hypothetical protein
VVLAVMQVEDWSYEASRTRIVGGATPLCLVKFSFVRGEPKVQGSVEPHFCAFDTEIHFT